MRNSFVYLLNGAYYVAVDVPYGYRQVPIQKAEESPSAIREKLRLFKELPFAYEIPTIFYVDDYDPIWFPSFDTEEDLVDNNTSYF